MASWLCATADVATRFGSSSVAGGIRSTRSDIGRTLVAVLSEINMSRVCAAIAPFAIPCRRRRSGSSDLLDLEHRGLQLAQLLLIACLTESAW